MKKEHGQNQLNENLKVHRSFDLYDKEGWFARYDYDEELKQYQSCWGYLTIDAVIEISKDETDDRYVVWK